LLTGIDAIIGNNPRAAYGAVDGGTIDRISNTTSPDGCFTRNIGMVSACPSASGASDVVDGAGQAEGTAWGAGRSSEEEYMAGGPPDGATCNRDTDSDASPSPAAAFAIALAVAWE
jgi:hypothetical protein